MVVYTTAHTAVHQRSNGWLLGAGVKEILCLVVAVHRASGQTVLGEGQKDRKQDFRCNIDRKGEVRVGTLFQTHSEI